MFIELELADDIVNQIDELVSKYKSTRHELIKRMLISFLKNKQLTFEDGIEIIFERLLKIQERNHFKEGWVWYKLIEYYPDASFIQLKEYAQRLGLSLGWAEEQLKPTVDTDDIPF